MNILITGGAGYIGSTVAHNFIDKKHSVTIIDNLVNGSSKNLPKKCKFMVKNENLDKILLFPVNDQFDLKYLLK